VTSSMQRTKRDVGYHDAARVDVRLSVLRQVRTGNGDEGMTKTREKMINWKVLSGKHEKRVANGIVRMVQWGLGRRVVCSSAVVAGKGSCCLNEWSFGGRPRDRRQRCCKCKCALHPRRWSRAQRYNAIGM